MIHNRNFMLLVWLSSLATAVAAVEPGRSFDTQSRAAWTTSAVVGSPEPPPPYRLKRTFTNLDISQPIYVIREPQSSFLWVIQHLGHWSGPGKIIRFANDPQVDSFEVLLEKDYLIYGMTFHPRFAENGYLYLVANGPSSAKNKFNRILRYTVRRDPKVEIVRDSELVILEWEANGHNGGDLAFGSDGYLYIPSGDGTSDSDEQDTGQDLADLRAVMIRIDVDRPTENKPYSIPSDNPFVGVPGARPEIWAYGFRNPWRMCIDRRTGLIWVGNNGQDLWEQVFLVERGGNYGWSVTEGGHPFQPERRAGPTPIIKPAIEHPHSEFRSLTGGVVYYGDDFPELKGTYFYGDFSTGKVWGARHDGKRISWNGELADTSLQIVGFGLDERGELLILDSRTGIYRLERAPPPEPTQPFPRRLSETGLFASVPNHQLAAGVIPYSVNAQLWSDGAHKERYLALPDAAQIEFTKKKGWRFDDGTVAVKSFALELEQGNLASRRWVETRLLTKQQNEWVGYSYRWNEEQTDAVLVAAGGADQAFTIRDSAASTGSRTQTWHYPSRAECMVCHTREANFVLGLSTLQMNKYHDYGGTKENQLAVFDRLGLFRKVVTTNNGKPADLFDEPAAAYAKLVDPYDTTANLNDRARSYLHANCAFCHVRGGGGNALMELDFTADREKVRIFDVAPQHHKFGIAEARLVASGDADRSLIYLRVTRRGLGQMPPLATSIVDEKASHLLAEWIKRMPTVKP